jgi:hypothetical protein
VWRAYRKAADAAEQEDLSGATFWANFLASPLLYAYTPHTRSARMNLVQT